MIDRQDDCPMQFVLNRGIRKSADVSAIPQKEAREL